MRRLPPSTPRSWSGKRRAKGTLKSPDLTFKDSGEPALSPVIGDFGLAPFWSGLFLDLASWILFPKDRTDPSTHGKEQR
jgi:hypothetical protein